MNRKILASMKGMLGISTTLILMSIPTVQAQTENTEEIEEVFVTGSRIKRSDFNSASPVSVIDGEALKLTGLGDIGESIRRNMAAGSGGFNQSSTLSGGGATSIDLRNLGQDRTLTLINGKRMASFTDALANEAADLTLIPNAMVERVEILRDGASAVYGSDAITGVINVILKDDFEGIEFSAQGGVSDESDADSTQLSLIMGTSGENSNIVMGLEYRHRDPVANDARDWAFPNVTSVGASGTNNGSFFSPGGHFFGDGAAGVPGAQFCTEPKLLGGDEITDVSGTPQGCPSSRSQSNRHELARYDYGLVQNMRNESDIITASIFANHEFSEEVRMFTEIQYSKRESDILLDGNPGTFGTPSIPQGWRVPASNPNNPTGQDGSFFIRPTTTIGPRSQNIEADTIRLVGGFTGEFDIGLLDKWSWETSYLYTRVTSTAQTRSTWNLARANTISDPALCAADSLCASIVNPSGALDTLRPGNWTLAEISYIRQNTQSSSKFQTNGFFTTMSGPIIELPAGSLGAAIGYEFRQEKGENVPDPVTESGESVANQVFRTQGRFEVNEVFAEIDVPLLSGMTFAEDLSANFQGRYSDYDTFGSESVWRTGINWQITDDIRVRVSQATAYRAPLITDLFSGGVVSFDFFTDPCTDSAARSANASLNANCLADGVPLGASQAAQQYPVLSGGNPDLQPETADTYTFGVVITPGFADGLSITVDFWDIEVEDIIDRPTSDSIVDECYIDGDASQCAKFDRNALNFAILNLENALINDVDKNSTTGFDWRVNYGFDIGSAVWSVDWQGVYVKENTLFPEAGGADQRGSIPRIKSNLNFATQWDAWRFGWYISYVHSMDDPGAQENNVLGYGHISAHTEHDLRVGYDWDKYRLTVGVNNVLDEAPEFIQASSTNTDTFTYDVVGRFAFVNLTANF